MDTPEKRAAPLGSGPERRPERPDRPRKYACCICPQKFFTKTHLDQHMWIHSEQKPFVCDICGQAFRQIGNLRTHMFVHTGEKPYACDLCEDAFTTSSYLKKHKSLKHDIIDNLGISE